MLSQQQASASSQAVARLAKQLRRLLIKNRQKRVSPSATARCVKILGRPHRARRTLPKKSRQSPGNSATAASCQMTSSLVCIASTSSPENQSRSVNLALRSTMFSVNSILPSVMAGQFQMIGSAYDSIWRKKPSLSAHTYRPFAAHLTTIDHPLSRRRSIATALPCCSPNPHLSVRAWA